MLPRATYHGISWIDALFTATSATCVTGLVSVDVPSTFTLEGQIIIILLIQIGGLGVMTLTSFFAMFFMGNTSLYNQLVVGDMISSNSLNSLLSTLLYILGFTLAIEGIGMVIIWYSIHNTLGMTLQQEIYFAAFHSVSAFCNAGFSTLPGNLGNAAVMQNHNLLFITVSFLIILGILISMLYVVRQQSVAIVERFGRYQKIATSGIHMRLPFGIDKIAARIQLRLLQSEIVVETKTKDNVFVMMNVATQYRVNEQNVTDAYYKLMRPEAQIKSYIEDALRSSVPKLTLDELFEKKDEIALEVQHQVAEEMTTYGYIIVKTLITKVEPDAEVKQSMNEINAAQRKRVAAQELAEADKIKIVTAAEAEAEKDRLHGVGIAQQRKAIVDGLAESIAELKEANVGMSEEQIMSILLTNQYLDTLNTFAAKGNQTLFLPNNPNGVDDIRTQILSALKTDNKN